MLSARGNAYMFELVIDLTTIALQSSRESLQTCAVGLRRSKAVLTSPLAHAAAHQAWITPSSALLDTSDTRLNALHQRQLFPSLTVYWARYNTCGFYQAHIAQAVPKQQCACLQHERGNMPSAMKTTSGRDNMLQPEVSRLGTGTTQLPPAPVDPACSRRGVMPQPEEPCTVEVDISKPILAQVSQRCWGRQHWPCRVCCPALFHDPTHCMLHPHPAIRRAGCAGGEPGTALQGVGALAGARRPALFRLADAGGTQLHSLVNGPSPCAVGSHPALCVLHYRALLVPQPYTSTMRIVRGKCLVLRSLAS
jgi:hypothetical protein